MSGKDEVEAKKKKRSNRSEQHPLLIAGTLVELSARWGHPSTRYEKRRCTDATRRCVRACVPVYVRAQETTRECVAAQT